MTVNPRVTVCGTVSGQKSRELSVRPEEHLSLIGDTRHRSATRALPGDAEAATAREKGRHP
ncbi:hypothetical protein GCM10009555_087640 [Acrocarpospora macrocephala]|uniref:Uncharacterized protein n=1 Tax=Acrocarpospora macrocephala TaxID=150177 RepID=A0A5M3WQ24_9ACTN|nr:hypothetical protein Amac_023990 [Acrocarpospora macrocephala]